MAIQTFGTELGGFSIVLHEATRSVRLSAWGFWSLDVSEVFAKSVIEACTSAGRGLHLVLEATELKPQRDQGQEALGALIGALPRLGVSQLTIATGNALTRLQLLRIANASPGKALVRFTEASRATHGRAE